ncbi:MAG: hypothetical protein LBF22_05645, partial [Deltaproteobacteria bacterium]|nr:hypothetical protein [Deltaproteobacteria bacterium]
IFHVNELYKAGLILKDNTDELIERAYKRQNRLLDSSERLSQQYHEGLESMVSDGYSSMPSKNRR